MTRKQNKESKPRQFSGAPRGRPRKQDRQRNKKSQQEQPSKNLDYQIFPPEMDQINLKSDQRYQQIQAEQVNDQSRENENQQKIYVLIQCSIIDFFEKLNQNDNQKQKSKNNFAKGHVFSIHDQSLKERKAKVITREKLIKGSNKKIKWAAKEDWIQEQEIQKIKIILEQFEFAPIKQANQSQIFRDVCINSSGISCSEASMQIYLIIARLWVSSMKKEDDSQIFAKEIFENKDERFPFYSYNFKEDYKPNPVRLRQQLLKLCKNIYKIIQEKVRKGTAIHQEMLSNEKL